MSFSLYAATIPSCQQIVDAVGPLLAKAEAHCAEQRLAPAELIQARLAPDMFPFAYQVRQVVAHSSGAIEAVRKGVYTPDRSPPPDSFAALKALVAAAASSLRAVRPEEVDGFLGRDMRFEFGDTRMDFTAENYLLSFAQPNFYFHATTAYDILRWKGLQIGKRDFIGVPRLKR